MDKERGRENINNFPVYTERLEDEGGGNNEMDEWLLRWQGWWWTTTRGETRGRGGGH